MSIHICSITILPPFGSPLPFPTPPSSLWKIGGVKGFSHQYTSNDSIEIPQRKKEILEHTIINPPLLQKFKLITKLEVLFRVILRAVLYFRDNWHDDRKILYWLPINVIMTPKQPITFLSVWAALFIYWQSAVNLLCYRFSTLGIMLTPLSDQPTNSHEINSNQAQS